MKTVTIRMDAKDWTEAFQRAERMRHNAHHDLRARGDGPKAEAARQRFVDAEAQLKWFERHMERVLLAAQTAGRRTTKRGRSSSRKPAIPGQSAPREAEQD